MRILPRWWCWLFPRVRKFWETVRYFIPRLRSFFSFEAEISSRTLSPLFRPGSVHSGSASRDDCDRVFLDELRVSSLPDRFPHYIPGQQHSQPTPTSLGQGVRVFKCNLPPALLADRTGSVTCYCGNTGVERTPNNSQHTKLTLEKKILPPPLPGFELATFRSRVRHIGRKSSFEFLAVRILLRSCKKATGIDCRWIFNVQ